MVAASGSGTGDYGHHHVQLFDDAGPAIWALMHGRFGDLPDVQPLMGLTSILWRLPFAAVGYLTGGLLGEYRFGAFACAWPLVTLGFALAAALREQPPLIRLTPALLIVLTPAMTQAITAGHPEDLLMAALAVAGVWAVVERRVTLGAILLGLAIGTKPFGAFALAAALLGAPQHWRRVLPITLLVAALLVLPLPVSSLHTYRALASELGHYKRVYSSSLWWSVSDERTIPISTGEPGPEELTIHVMKGGLDRGSGTEVMGLFALVVLGLGWLQARRRALGFDALALLCACLLGRAVLDPLNLEYYMAPAIAALIAWEVLARRRAPFAGALAVALDYLTFHAGLARADPQATVLALWSIATFAFLAISLGRRRA